MPSRLQALLTLTATLLCLYALSASGQAPNLFELTIADAPVENGKRLNMTLREVERAEEYSLVDVTFISGGSVSSSMFILTGMCGIARARGENYFVSNDEGQTPRRYRVRFPKSPAPEEASGPSKKVFSLAECALLGY